MSGNAISDLGRAGGRPRPEAWPCLVTFLKLPPEQRLKVYLFLGVVHGLTVLSTLPNPEVDIIDFGNGSPDR